MRPPPRPHHPPPPGNSTTPDIRQKRARISLLRHTFGVPIARVLRVRGANTMRIVSVLASRAAAGFCSTILMVIGTASSDIRITVISANTLAEMRFSPVLSESLFRHVVFSTKIGIG